MSPKAKTECHAAVEAINVGEYSDAIVYLRYALVGTTNRRAWSKIMLAIRELGRIV